MGLSVFVLRAERETGRPAGVHGVAFVDYEEGGVLSYHELLVARVVRDGRALRVRVTDIWVDSPESLAGGRALWAIPKQLAELPLRDRPLRVGRRTAFSAVSGGRHLASGTFTSVPGAALVRTPYAVTVSQLREDGSSVVAPMVGSARVVPCRGSWRFDADGPLGFLRGRRPVVSLRLRDVRLRFG